jgi:tRNA A37 threonylcarbamoyltransferase TsaD
MNTHSQAALTVLGIETSCDETAASVVRRRARRDSVERGAFAA